MVFSYFWLFVGFPMGLFSAIIRILKTMAVAALMLPRIDHSIMPDGFQSIDPGNIMFQSKLCGRNLCLLRYSQWKSNLIQ